MAADLVLAIGVPAAMLLIAMGLLLRHGGALPQGLERLRRHQAAFWNAGVGLIIAISALRWLLNG